MKTIQGNGDDKIYLTCEIHNYSPNGQPRRHTGCQQCIMVDFLDHLARVPASEQRAYLDRFEGMITAMCELEDKGELDLNFMRHPVVTIEKDGREDLLENEIN